MPKQNFANKIKRYQNLVQDDKEKEVAAEILEKIKHDQDFFVRKKVDGKVDIASCVLLFTPGYKKILFLDHVKLKAWTTPGGHADGEFDLYKVALDELREEVGIDIEYNIEHQKLPSLLHKFDYKLETFGHKKSIITLFYVITCPDDQEPQNLEPTKHNQIKWMDLKEAKEIAKTDETQVIYKFIDVWENLVK